MQNITTQNLIQLSEINFQNFEETLQVQKAILPDNIQQWDKETWLNAILKFFPSLHENFVAEELRRSGSKNRLFGAHANFLNFVDSSELVRFFFEFKQMYFDRLSDNRKKLWMDIITEDVDALSSSYLSPELLFSKFGENRLEILENWNPSPCEVVHKNSLLQKVLFQNIQSTFKKSNLKEDGAGRALLHYAAALGITDICLSFSNKDYLKKDNKGQTPIEYAIRYRQQECVLNILASKKISGPLIESMGVKLTRSAIRFYLMDVVAFLIEQESVLKEITTQHNEIFTEIARCGQHTLLKKLRNHPEIIKLIKISGDATIKALVVGDCVDTLKFLFEKHNVKLTDYEAVRLAILWNRLAILQLFEEKFNIIEKYFKESTLEAVEYLIEKANPEVCSYLLQNTEVKKQLLLNKHRLMYHLIYHERFEIIPTLLSHEVIDLNIKIHPSCNLNIISRHEVAWMHPLPRTPFIVREPQDKYSIWGFNWICWQFTPLKHLTPTWWDGYRKDTWITPFNLGEDLFNEIHQGHVVPMRSLVYILTQHMLTSFEARKALIFCLMRGGTNIHSNSLEIPHLEEFNEHFEDSTQRISMLNKKFDKEENPSKVKFSYCLQRLGQFSEKMLQKNLSQQLKEQVELALCSNEPLKKIIERSEQTKLNALGFFSSLFRLDKNDQHMKIPSYLKKIIFLKSIGITSDSSAAAEVLDNDSVERILMKL